MHLNKPDTAGASPLSPSSPPPQAQNPCLEPAPAGAPPSAAEPDPGEPLPSPRASRPESDPAGTALPSPPPESDPAGGHLPSPSPPAIDQSRFKLLSLLDCGQDVPSASDSSDGHGADNSDGHSRGESAVAPQHSYNSGSDDDEDPILTDRYGNLTTWRLSDMEAALEKHLEDEASKPKVEEKKHSKEEILKRDADRKKQLIEYALQKYNNEEDIPEEVNFVFDEIKGDVYIIEEGMKFYEHFNFTAKQAGSTVLFFAEVIPDGDTCDVLCCKPLDFNDNGHCFGCKNQRSANLRHPADEALYVGGHEDCQFPFMWDSISEDDSD